MFRYTPPALNTPNRLQWLMTLITQASKEELIQLEATAERDMHNLINLYHQVSMLLCCQVIFVCLMAFAAFVSVQHLCWLANLAAHAHVRKGGILYGRDNSSLAIQGALALERMCLSSS